MGIIKDMAKEKQLIIKISICKNWIKIEPKKLYDFLIKQCEDYCFDKKGNLITKEDAKEFLEA